MNLTVFLRVLLLAAGAPAVSAAQADVHRLVTYQPEPRIEALFGSFGELRTDAALAAGFERDASLADLVRSALQGDASDA